MDLHKAIKTIHNNVITINGDTQEKIIAKDKDGNTVTINWSQVNAWTDPNEYKYKRQAEYPSIADQLDKIYHDGIDEWKKVIKVIKDKYPKE
jgi:hypothetical protein|tara:strand:- start:20 stop:295 length:276 start_codon:yes stop_codon:yes gene_type:complete